MARGKKANGPAKPKKPSRGQNDKPRELDPPAKALILHHHSRIMRANQKKDEAVAALRNARKGAKSDGMNMTDYDAVVRLSKLDPKEQNTTHNNRTLYMRALGVALGGQLELFDVSEPDNSPEAVEKRAYDRGYQDGVEGKPEAESTYDPGSKAGQAYLQGHRAGQRELSESVFAKQQGGKGAAPLNKTS